MEHGDKIQFTNDDKFELTKAMEGIENAQRIIYKATEQLGTIPGFADQWNQLVEIHRDIKATWSEIDQRRGEVLRQSQLDL